MSKAQTWLARVMTNDLDRLSLNHRAVERGVAAALDRGRTSRRHVGTAMCEALGNLIRCIGTTNVSQEGSIIDI